MSKESPAEKKPFRRTLVAGDVCLDVVGVPLPAKSVPPDAENWQLSGKTRTHFLPGGAMLLAKFIRSSRMSDVLAVAERAAQAQIELDGLSGEKADDLLFMLKDETRRFHTRIAEDEVLGPRPKKPAGIVGATPDGLYQDDFLEIAERLKRDEIVHSLIAADLFTTTSDPNDKTTTLRVEKTFGFSGPSDTNLQPSLELEYLKADVDILVLDDTGNSFRKGFAGNPWPESVKQAASDDKKKPLIVYKLHRPLPSSESVNELWEAVKEHHADNRIVIVSVDDLRDAGAPISLGLSWERTALDVIWHLLHFAAFKDLRESRRLVVRLGLDGAVLWLGDEMEPGAFLVCDPKSIEGGFAFKVPGEMVSCGSAFTAAFVKHLAEDGTGGFLSLLGPEPAAKHIPTKAIGLVLAAIKEGLSASRRLLQLGFGRNANRPNYPGPDLYKGGGARSFGHYPVPIIRGASEPDRSFWRLLDDIFRDERKLRNTAVRLTATAQTAGRSKEEKDALDALKSAPEAKFGALRTYDRREIEHYRALHTLLRDYLSPRAVSRPLSIGVFGPPGAGKSFGVKEVAASLKGQRDCKEVHELTFNLSLYQTPEELVGAFHLVRDAGLRGKVPLVFFDEFDTSIVAGQRLSWLRHFLAPMQDGEFLDRGAPHPIGQAIFVFAGGTSSTYREFSRHVGMTVEEFKSVKGPDFLSRLRAVLDIPSLNFLTAWDPTAKFGRESQPLGTFDPFGPVESFPCETAILLRRASILAFNLPKKGPGLKSGDGSLRIKPEVLRALLHLQQFEHGNRSFEALLDMSHLVGVTNFTPSLLPAPFQILLHGDSDQLQQLLLTDYPFPESERLAIAREIHRNYQAQRKADPSHDPHEEALKDWDNLREEFRMSNLEQADDIAMKLRTAGLWFRRIIPGAPPDPNLALRLEDMLETLAKSEHDRWIAEKRRGGWIPAADTSRRSRSDALQLHNFLFPWVHLDGMARELDRGPVQQIPEVLKAGGYEIYRPPTTSLL